MLWAILNKSWRQHSTKQQLYGHLLPITKTIQVRWTRHARHCWRSRDELISDVLPGTTSHGRAKAGRPARTYIQLICVDTGCSPVARSDELLGGLAREGHGYPCWLHKMVRDDIYIYIYIYNSEYRWQSQQGLQTVSLSPMRSSPQLL